MSIHNGTGPTAASGADDARQALFIRGAIEADMAKPAPATTPNTARRSTCEDGLPDACALGATGRAHIPRLSFPSMVGQSGPRGQPSPSAGSAEMSIQSPISLVALCLCLLALATTTAHASWEVEEPMAQEVGPRAVTLTCARDMTDAQSLACEEAAMRWKLCQRVYASEPRTDDAFYACFEGAN
jgi:hypothetical protein